MIDKLLTKGLTENKDNETVTDIKIGDVISFSNAEVSYRIISLIGDEVQLVQMQIHSINIKAVSKEYIEDLLDRSEIEILPHMDRIVNEDKINSRIREAHDTDIKIAIEMQKYFNNEFTMLKTQTGTNFAQSQIERYKYGESIDDFFSRDLIRMHFMINAFYHMICQIGYTTIRSVENQSILLLEKI